MLNGPLHNSLGPAFIYYDGRKHWCVNGKLHRLDGPAIECADGSEEWWESGRRHRLDGPAIELTDGSKYWYVAGKDVSEKNFLLAVISFLLGVNKKTAKIIEREMKK